MQYIEITKQAFYAIVADDTEHHAIDELELARKFHYRKYGCSLMIVYNFIGGITQYYIADINS